MFVLPIQADVSSEFIRVRSNINENLIIRYFLSIRFSLPWDQHTPFGYFLAIFYDVAVAATYLIPVPFILLFISFCQFHHAFYQMFQHSIRKLGQREEVLDNAVLLRELIQFHVETKE